MEMEMARGYADVLYGVEAGRASQGDDRAGEDAEVVEKMINSVCDFPWRL